MLGGGQLGRMLGLAGIPLGLGFRFLDPSPAAPGAVASATLVVGALDDEAALLETVEGADVVTYEWEGVPADAARMLEARGPHRRTRRRGALEVVAGPAGREDDVPRARHPGVAEFARGRRPRRPPRRGRRRSGSRRC